MVINSYGVREQYDIKKEFDLEKEQFERNGYALISSGFSKEKILEIKEEFTSIRKKYIQKYSSSYLESRNEHNGIRLPLLLSNVFLELAANERVIKFLTHFLGEGFILNQQNGVVNPAGEEYNQGKWHRDLPYQHFTTSRPIAINALYCVDEFTLNNGATKVIPSSHLHETFPSNEYIDENEKQIIANAGDYLILNCMLYHSGGKNVTIYDRCAVNHVYAAPIFAKQIQLDKEMFVYKFDIEKFEKLLGLRFSVKSGVSEYLESRIQV
ncbi:phytanoyl-CoA dioxygenase family protein [Endozoicomonas sp. ALD040]|uniref:phytanoyl-CoA dioxygenase family protein n=1 Tax=unclassified Endozoicomonas TaxID=2644528 RepID=UPI003BB21840